MTKAKNIVLKPHVGNQKAQVLITATNVNNLRQRISSLPSSLIVDISLKTEEISSVPMRS